MFYISDSQIVHLSLSQPSANDTAAIKDVVDSQNAAGVLLLAVKAANPPTISYLLSLDSIDPNEVDQDGNTALHIAASINRADVVELLLQNDAINDSVRNNNARTAFEICKSESCASIIHDSQIKLNEKYRDLVSEYIRPSSPDSRAGEELIQLLKLPRSPVIDLSYIDTQSGSTLLHSAAAKKDFQLIKVAFENAAASSTIIDSRQKTLLSSCKDDQIKSFIKLQERQKPNAQNVQTRNKKGILKKYVNMASGWQNRHFVLQDGLLNYYLSPDDEAKQLSRGSINLEYGRLKEDKSVDNRKFEIHSPNNKFLVRADHPTDAASWKQAINLTIQDIKSGDRNSIDVQRSPSISGGRSLYAHSHSHSRHGSKSSLTDFQSVRGASPTYSIDETIESYDVNSIPHADKFELEGQKLSAHIEATESLMNTFLKDDAEGDKESHNERKQALKGSIETLHGLVNDWQAMVNDREVYYKKVLQHERETARLWEENIATIAVETAKVEGELENIHKSQEERRKALKQKKSDLHDAALGTSSLSPPSKAAVIDSGETAPTRSDGNIYAGQQDDQSGVSAPPQAAQHAPIKDAQRPSPMARVSSEEDDDDDDFFDAVEEGTLPINQDIVQAEKDDPPVEDLVPYEPYRELRSEMPISDDKRPPISLWSVLKNSIGKDLTKISFPVMFNEPTSMLQRMAEDMEFTECLDAAAKNPDPFKRVAYVAAFAASNYSSTMGRIAKPFNPMLGETFEYCRFDKQYRYFSEQVSHHPPMSACWGENPRWIYKGEVDAKNKFMGTSFEIRPTGIAHIELKLPATWAKEGVTYPREKCKVTGEELIIEHYSWKKVTTAVTGFITGSPVIDHFGDMVVVNHRTGESCTLTFKARPWRGKGQEIKGFVENAQKQHKWVIAGRWITQLVAKKIEHGTEDIGADEQIDNSAEYLLLWKNSEKPKMPFNLSPFAITLNDLPGDQLATLTPQERADLKKWLPNTDCRLRPDQRAFEIGLYDLANDLKIQNEEKQRATRKERETGKLPPHKPRWFNAVKDPDTGERVWMPTTTKAENGQNQIDYWTEREVVGKSRLDGDESRKFKNVDDVSLDGKLMTVLTRAATMTNAAEGSSDMSVLWQSIAMIVVSELGDKTFLIAAILAMRNPQLVVFSGSFGALSAMSVLSALLGQILPALLPKSYTQILAAMLFIVFGVKMFNDAKGMEGGRKEVEEEMQEAIQEIEHDGDDLPKPSSQRQKRSIKTTLAALLSPAFVQAFILTFLGEWGDRSQISTIALAAAHGWKTVAFGTSLGHGMCTALAVLGGRIVASKISIKTVTFGGSALFVLFGFIYIWEILVSVTSPAIQA
ncbi:hypothetical protein E3Q23_01066 [Wallemia mellicola]|nr:hypothetical protein E3Q23_01066 [Wallemia mellicola]